MIYLITCAGSKKEASTLNKSSLEHLFCNDLLLEPRKKLITLTGINLDWSHTLPAWDLYSGSRSKLYPRVSADNWEKPCVKIKILSALFGWINHTDLIPHYDLRMCDLLKYNNKSVWRYWYELDILSTLVDKKNYIDLLSGDYRKAIHGNNSPIAKEPNAYFSDHYGVEKGKWLNNQLNNLIC